MADKISPPPRGYYILYLLTIVNFAAVVCLAIFYFQYDNTVKLPDIKATVERLIQDGKQEVTHIGRRNLADSQYEQLEEELVERCRQEVVDVLKEAAIYMKPTTADRKRQTSTAGNELASIFGEIAKTEVDLLAQYCNNGSTICLSGDKGATGEKGDPGIQGAAGQPGLKGERGLNGLNGSDGVDGVKGDKGDPGLKGEVGTRGLAGQKGDQGIKGDNGSAGVQGLKGEAGLVGSKGEPGSAGPNGVDGAQGQKGDTGSVGLKGEPGSPGSAGVAGTQGVKGAKGEPGARAVPITPLPFPTPTPCCNNLAVPMFGKQLEEIRVTEGTAVTMNCDANGFPTPTFSWTPTPNSFDSTRTTVAPSRITISNTLINDSHLYTCSAQNALGMSEKQFMLKVYEHLQFAKAPSNDTVMMGNSVTFECDVTGPLNPNATWYKVMKDGSRFQISSGITGTRLTVPSVRGPDEGQYVCVGSNGVESIESSAYLSTFGPPHIRPPGVVNAIKGQETRLRCIADAHPPATITWTYPPGVTNAYKDTDGSLVILKTEPKDAVYFICTATNRYGTDQATVNVQVKVPPEVTVTPQNGAVIAGVTNVAIECKTTGDTPLSVTWSKDGRQITSGGRVFILPGNVLLVNKATAADYGIYTCTATNSIGSASQSAYVYDGSSIATPVSCAYTFSNCQDNVCAVNCPANCGSDSHQVYGFMSYHQSSSACRAGIQSGSIPANGGTLVWYSIKSTLPYSSGNQNGVASQTHAAGNGAIPVV